MAVQPLKMVTMDGKPAVVLESDFDGSKGQEFPNAITELQSPNTKQAALSYASQQGVVNPRCDKAGMPYPVDESGNIVLEPGRRIHRYRTDVVLSSL